MAKKPLSNPIVTVIHSIQCGSVVIGESLAGELIIVGQIFKSSSYYYVLFSSYFIAYLEYF